MTLQLKAAIAWVIAWTALYFSVATIPDPAGYFGLMVMIPTFVALIVCVPAVWAAAAFMLVVVAAGLF